MQNVTDRRIYMHTTAMYRSVGVFKYLLRALGSQGRTCSSPVSPEIVRRRIWTVVDFPDNTVRQSLRQVPPWILTTQRVVPQVGCVVERTNVS